MAIVVTCADCDREFKVKDELAGRRVKCPECAAVVAVPGGTKKAAVKKPVPPPEDDDEFEEEERPRRKKRKKRKKSASNPALLWGLIGGGVGLILIIVLLILLNPFGGSGAPVAEKKTTPLPEVPALPPNFNPVVTPKPRPTTGVPRPLSVRKTEVAARLKQLAIAYHSYDDAHRKGPQDAKALAPFCENAQSIIEMVSGDTGWVIVQWGVGIRQMTAGATNTVLAYESQPDQTGQRLVLMGDGSVRDVPEAEFAKMPKAGK